MKLDDFSKPVPRAGIIAKLVQDAKALQATGNQKPILLCFTCDPYMQIEGRCGSTRQALEILLRHE